MISFYVHQIAEPPPPPLPPLAAPFPILPPCLTFFPEQELSHCHYCNMQTDENSNL